MLKAIRVFEKIGFFTIRQGKHVIMTNGFIRLTISRHNPIDAYKMGALARDAGLSPEEFIKLL